MAIERKVSVNVDGIVYRQENDQVFINGREVTGIEAEQAKQTMVRVQRGVRERVANAQNHISRVRDRVRSFWR